MNINLKQHKGCAIKPGVKFKSTILALKKMDPYLLILPLVSATMDTIIHQITHVPSKSLNLDNYFESKLTLIRLIICSKYKQNLSSFN